MDKQAIQYPITPCETIGCDTVDHFRGVTKMVKIGKGAKRPVDDFMLTHRACG